MSGENHRARFDAIAKTAVGEYGYARRIQVERWTPAEAAIMAAVDAVEAMPADVRLTDAVVLLLAGRERVADYVDGIDLPAEPLAVRS